MQVALVSIIFVIIGIAMAIFTRFISYQARRKNILIHVRSLMEIMFFLIPIVAIFAIFFSLTNSIWLGLLAVLMVFLAYLLRYQGIYHRILPTPRHKWFYEIYIQSIMRTTETYPVKIILRPAVAELVYRNRRKTERLLRHFPLSFEEEPIAEKIGESSLQGEFLISSSSRPVEQSSVGNRRTPVLYSSISSVLTIKVNGPAFKIDPKESNVALELEPTSVEFLITPSKSGKHLLAFEFLNEFGRQGYLKTNVSVKDFIFFRFIKLTETQIKVISSIGYIIGIIGVIVTIWQAIG